MITLERAQRSVEGLRRSAALLDFRVYDGLGEWLGGGCTGVQ